MPQSSRNPWLRTPGERELQVTVLAQSGLYFLLGVHNPRVELFPEWGYAATFNGVVPLPTQVMGEMFGQSAVVWGPVCSPSFAASVKSAFEDWIEEMLTGDDEEDEDDDGFAIFIFDPDDAAQRFRLVTSP